MITSEHATHIHEHSKNLRVKYQGPPQELEAEGAAAAAQVADRFCPPQAHESPQPRRVGAEGKHTFKPAVQGAAGPELIQFHIHPEIIEDPGLCPGSQRAARMPAR